MSALCIWHMDFNCFTPGEGLLVANGPRWARSRRLLTPAFHFDIIKSYIPIYADAAKVMVVSTVGTK